MDIIIAGAGTVGYELARTLSLSDNVIVIDKDIKKLNRLDEDIDILTLHGNIENPQSYHSLHLESIDLFIAVTDSDEANLLSTLIIDEMMKVKQKIIRLKSNIFLKSSILQKLSIDYAVFPGILVADKIKSLLTFPKANNAKNFHLADEKLVSARVQYEGDVTYTVDDLNNSSLSIIGIERDRLFFIPTADEQIQKNDLIYLFGSTQAIRPVLEKLDNKMPSNINKVAIFGANKLSQEIAKVLVDNKVEVKIISKNVLQCEEASQELKGRVSVINSSYEDHRFFDEEGIKNADMVIATHSEDEKNIIKCIEAKEHGIENVVAINNDAEYYNLMHKLGVIALRGNKTEAHYAILEKISSSLVVKHR